MSPDVSLAPVQAEVDPPLSFGKICFNCLEDWVCKQWKEDTTQLFTQHRGLSGAVIKIMKNLKVADAHRLIYLSTTTHQNTISTEYFTLSLSTPANYETSQA